MARRSSQEWQTIIKQQEASGLSVTDFCEQQQISKKHFYARLPALRKKNQSKQTVSFVKVSKTPWDNGMMSLQLGNATLSLPANTEPEWLAQLFKALSA
jgi:putative transposase